MLEKSYMIPSLQISACLITLNEERNIRSCLESLDFCQEIVIVDGGSADQTTSIAREYSAKIIENKLWQGFGNQKQRAINSATNAWILSIDADEVVDDELRKEIIRSVQESSYDGFYLHRRSIFLGKHMRYGDWRRDYVLRLARKESCLFEQKLIHEKLIVTGRTKSLAGYLLHYSYPDIQTVLIKNNRYALTSAKSKVAESKCYSAYYALMSSFWTFIRNYFLKFGFLDGQQGLIAAISKSQEAFWKYAATRYLK